MANVYDLTKFETYKPRGRVNRNTSQQPYLRFSREIRNGRRQVNQATLSLPLWLGKLAMEALGDRCDLLFDSESRIIAIRRGNALKLSSGKSRSRINLSVSSWFDRFVRAYGDHRRVYFEADIYDNGVITLTPTGEVDDA